MKGTSMKKIISFILSFFLLTAAGCGEEKTADTQDMQVLNLFSWADNFSPEVLADFEKKYHCKINYDVFGSNEELLAKIHAGGSRYDLIQPSDYMVSTLLKLDLLEEMDKSKMPNTSYILPSLQHPPYDPDGRYSVVYTWGVTGIAYNKKYIKTAPSSWSDLWNDDYKDRLILLNDNREVIGMALKKRGRSVNSENPQEIKEALDDLYRLSPLILAYDTDTIKQKFIAEEAWIGMMWSGDASFSYRENPDIAFFIPKEGAVIWADTFAIPKGARNKELAEEFINYLYDPEVSAKNYEYIGYNDPNTKSAPYHSKEYKNDPMLKAAKKYIPLGEWIKDLGEVLPLYDRAWTELKIRR